MSSRLIVKFDFVCKSYGPRDVLLDLSFKISSKECFALIGENGSGKTTLAKMAAGLEFPDNGSIEIAPQCTIGYLPQDSTASMDLNVTVEEYINQSQQELYQLSKRLEELEKIIAASAQEDALCEWDKCNSRFMELDGYRSVERAKKCIKVLGLDRISNERKLCELSGGEKRRLHLAFLLIKMPNFLILDEPTNHLDKASIVWLEKYLKEFEGAVLLISHDRSFLNNTVEGIFELSIEHHNLIYYAGNYDSYVLTKKRKVSDKLKAYLDQKEEMTSLKKYLKEETFSSKKPTACKDLNKMAYDRHGERSVNSKRRSINRAKQSLEKLEEERLEHPIPKGYTGISFSPKPLEGSYIINLEDVQIAVHDKILINNLTKVVKAGERIILLGPNGCGKSTLLKTIFLREKPRGGIIEYASSCVIGYLDQEGEIQDQNLTILDYFYNRFNLDESELRSRLHRIALLKDQHLFLKVKELSLGQKRKLQLLELMLSQANVLVLDEPTNHLAPYMIDQLEDALINFPGVVIAATHDNRFHERVGTATWSW